MHPCLVSSRLEAVLSEHSSDLCFQKDTHGSPYGRCLCMLGTCTEVNNIFSHLWSWCFNQTLLLLFTRQNCMPTFYRFPRLPGPFIIPLGGESWQYSSSLDLVSGLCRPSLYPHLWLGACPLQAPSGSIQGVAWALLKWYCIVKRMYLSTRFSFFFLN